MIETVNNFITAHALFFVLLLVTAVLSLANFLSSLRHRPSISLADLKKEAAGYCESQKQRMWEHFLHDDNVFNDRLNFLLVFESVLLGIGIGAITSRATTSVPALQGFALFGLAITLLWSYVQARHKRGLDALKTRTRALFPEYTLGAIERGKAPFSSTWLLTYLLPWLILGVWLSILFLLGA